MSYDDDDDVVGKAKRVSDGLWMYLDCNRDPDCT